MIGSIVITAHDDAEVTERAVRRLAPLIDQGVEVIVSMIECTADAADGARAVPGVVVIESPKASKADALNAADAVARSFPRLYLGADTELDHRTAARVLEGLRFDGFMAGRPSFRYDYAAADWVVRAYYRARGRMPSVRSRLSGAGVYALSDEGHDRLMRLPELAVDDQYIDSLFERAELRIIYAYPAVVRTPKNVGSLITGLRRAYRAEAELLISGPLRSRPKTSSAPLRELLVVSRSPLAWFDAVVYGACVLWARGTMGSTPTQTRSRSGSSTASAGQGTSWLMTSEPAVATP